MEKQWITVKKWNKKKWRSKNQRNKELQKEKMKRNGKKLKKKKGMIVFTDETKMKMHEKKENEKNLKITKVVNERKKNWRPFRSDCDEYYKSGRDKLKKETKKNEGKWINLIKMKEKNYKWGFKKVGNNQEMINFRESQGEYYENAAIKGRRKQSKTVDVLNEIKKM